MIFSSLRAFFICFILALCFCTGSFGSTTHTVRKGDSLSSIGKRYGISVQAIKNHNGISNANLIKAGQVLKIPGKEPTNFGYKIRKGDSLSTIAKKHGTTAKKIAELSGIRNLHKISVGQVVKIPIDSNTRRSGGHQHDYSSLPSNIKSSLDKIAVRGGWKHIVIHHTATDTGKAQNMDRYHREERRMENGLAYHFVIGNGRGMKNGEIYIGDRWKRQIHGGHLKSHTKNKIAIGICLVGNFEKRPPSSKQLDQLESLIHYLMRRTGIHHSGITTHKVIHPNHTLCPGKKFPTNSFLKKFE